MSEQGALRRPVLLASAGLVTATIIYFAYSAYLNKPQENNGLHRRNAIRRSRRRWRRGFAPRSLTSDPMTDAIRNLNGRIASRKPYGTYENRLLFEPNQEHLEQGHYDLIPQNLGPLYDQLSVSRPFSGSERENLNFHIESLFLQTFLEQEFPAGYIIGDDVESLVHALRSHGINEKTVRDAVERFDAGRSIIPEHWDLHNELLYSTEILQTDGAVENVTPRDAIDALRGPTGDNESVNGWADGEDSDPGGSQGMLDLLYHIAGEQAKREGLVHRGIECNSCGVVPIRGIRYHCVNCFDYDLCETCEAQQIHTKTHVFYKIRIPAPPRGHIKQVIPAWYPGIPNSSPITIPRRLAKLLMETYKTGRTELDSFYEQFKCLAGYQFSAEADPAGLGVAIDRKSFDMYFTTTSEDRPPPPNLLYDRIFAFYDANNDHLITFDEFVRGMSDLQDRTRSARVRRMFQGYDLDADGYVSRRDFLRLFRAYYSWHKDFTRENTINRAELDDDLRDAVHGSQPISAAFGWNEFSSHVSRGGQDKTMGANGDLEIEDGPDGVLQNNSDIRGDRARFIGDFAVRGQTRAPGYRLFRSQPPRDEAVIFSFNEPSNFGIDHALYPGDATHEEISSSDPRINIYGWPPSFPPEQSDVVNALGADLPLEEIMDPTDQARVIYAQSQRMDEEYQSRLTDVRNSAVRQRWQRRQFYLDEEEGLSKPPGYTEPDSSDDEAVSIFEESKDDGNDATVPPDSVHSRRQSMRSRSSSKVRFDESAIDTDHETRSNASSRSMQVNERWGGFEFGEPERDIGKEMLYQAVQQGFNELLDPLFQEKEAEAMNAIATKANRLRWRTVLDAFQEKLLSTTQDEDINLAGKAMSEHSDRLSTSSTKPQKLSSTTQSGTIDTSHDEQPSEKADLDSLIPEDESILPTTPPDTTLPHNRPNDEFTASLLSPLFNLSDLDHLNNNNTTTDTDTNSPNDTTTTPPPSETTLKTWLVHDTIELEAQIRGGYGRISFNEFKKKLVQESIGGTKHDFDTGNSDDEDEEIWNSTANLGKLSFLGSWLEMVQF